TRHVLLSKLRARARVRGRRTVYGSRGRESEAGSPVRRNVIGRSLPLTTFQRAGSRRLSAYARIPRVRARISGMLRFPRQSCRIICVWLLTLLVRTTSAHADRGTELSAYLEDYKRLRLEAQELVRLAKKADLGDDGGLVALGKRILDVRVRLNRF